MPLMTRTMYWAFLFSARHTSIAHSMMRGSLGSTTRLAVCTHCGSLSSPGCTDGCYQACHSCCVVSVSCKPAVSSNTSAYNVFQGWVRSRSCFWLLQICDLVQYMAHQIIAIPHQRVIIQRPLLSLLKLTMLQQRRAQLQEMLHCSSAKQPHYIKLHFL